jgi:hypothetical protein
MPSSASSGASNVPTVSSSALKKLSPMLARYSALRLAPKVGPEPSNPKKAKSRVGRATPLATARRSMNARFSATPA